MGNVGHMSLLMSTKECFAFMVTCFCSSIGNNVAIGNISYDQYEWKETQLEEQEHRINGT